MSRVKIRLSRNLRRSILQGHPWIYREAIGAHDAKPGGGAQLAQVFDQKGDELAWAIYDPQSPLALRILSTESKPPTADYFTKRFEKALALRKSVRSEQTTAFRLFNGEGDWLPGLVCDVYGPVAVIQFDGQGPGEFWDRELVANWLIQNAGVQSVVEKARRQAAALTLLAGAELSSHEVDAKENGAIYKVNFEKGQKTGFFLDQRDNRKFVREIARDKSVLNLFSYTGGFSIAAGLGGAASVTSVDISKGAIEGASENWKLNSLPEEKHKGIATDVFEFLASGDEKWDHIIVDPPSMSPSEAKKEVAMQKYIETFAAAAKRVRKGGELSISSCSSHISFEDFQTIAVEALSSARRRGQIVRISGQGLDHPFPHACPEMRYLKFVHIVLDP